MLNLQILTPDKEIFSGTVDMVSVPSTEGILGILPKHINLFASLTEGIIKIKNNSQEDYFSIGGGFVKVEKDKTTILVSRAVGASELDEQAIEVARNNAQNALKTRPSASEMLQYQAILRQTLFDLRLLRRHKKHAI